MDTLPELLAYFAIFMFYAIGGAFTFDCAMYNLKLDRNFRKACQQIPWDPLSSQQHRSMLETGQLKKQRAAVNLLILRFYNSPFFIALIIVFSSDFFSNQKDRLRDNAHRYPAAVQQYFCRHFPVLTPV